ncbi:MAG: ATP-binding protein [Clostridia bacterium]|nr:ATP-binding protein [Clostridia bacterium]
MIRKLVRQMLTAQILSALTVSLCLLIDSLMIGRFLGERALTAYGLANPLLLVIGAAGSMLCAGAQVACSKSIGRGDQKETDIGFSSTIAAGGTFALAFTLPVLLLRVPVARMLGAAEPALLGDTAGYIAGFSIGAPASVGALMLVPFLQMAGQSSLLIVAVLGMTVSDVAFDLLNVFVFHGGMFGMGLASALSYYVAVAIGAGYFLSKRCVYAFSRSRIQRRKIRELIAGGVPSLFGMASSVAMIFCVNRILLGAGGESAVAAVSVINTIINASNCISTGTGGVALTLAGVLSNEEDRAGLSQLLRTLARCSVVLGISAMALLLVFAGPCTSLFIPEAGAGQSMAVRGLRIFSAGLVFCCLNNALKSSYQGTGRVRLMEVISVAENALLPILAAFLLSLAAGVRGVWFLYALSEAAALLGILGYVWLRKGRVTLRPEDVLLLRDDFGTPEKDLLEADPRSVGEVLALSREAEAFCLSRGGSGRLAAHLALCVEEMGTNIVTHGFSADGKNHLSIRLQYRKGAWTLRFRDDCMAFDPIRHVSENGAQENVGIHLAMRMADDARYTFSMNLNNLTLVLKEPR